MINVGYYVESNIISVWGCEDDQDPTCVRNPTGHMITIGGCPFLWSSK